MLNKERWFTSYCRSAGKRDMLAVRDVIAEQLESIRMREQLYLQNLIAAQAQYESGATESNPDSALNNIKLFESMLSKLCEMKLDCLEQLRKCADIPEAQPSESQVRVGLPENFRAAETGSGSADSVKAEATAD